MRVEGIPASFGMVNPGKRLARDKRLFDLDISGSFQRCEMGAQFAVGGFDDLGQRSCTLTHS